jgi:LCP family protein required for cell wall assembly
MSLPTRREKVPTAPAKPKWIPILGVLLLLAAGGWAAYTYFFAGAAPKNILILGLDEDKTRADVIVLAHLDPNQGIVNVLSIPRDTLVEIDCKGLKDCMTPDKVNHAHAYGGEKGPEVTVGTVERFLGVKVDGYVRFDFEGFAKVVDALGGVDILISQNMYYHDPTAKPPLLINFKASKEPQHLNGKQALNYIRYRDETGDIGRTERTRNFLAALLKSVQKKGVTAKLPGLIGSLTPYVKTDVNVATATALAKTAPKVDSSNVGMASIPGDPIYLKDGRWVWQAKVQETQKLVDSFIKNPQPKP